MPDIIDDILSASGLSGKINQPQYAQPGINSKSRSIIAGAKKLGIDPLDYATVMSYESAGTFDPWKAGPVTKWGQHRGTIQYGEPQAKQYGVHQGQTFEDQVENSNVNYLRDRGVKPGDNITSIYKAINGGNVKVGNVSDGYGTIDDHVRRMMGAHRRKASRFLYGRQEGINNQSANGLSDDELIDGILHQSGLAGNPQTVNPPVPNPPVSDDELINHILSKSGLANPTAQDMPSPEQFVPQGEFDKKGNPIAQISPTVQNTPQNPQELSDIQNLQNKTAQTAQTDFNINPLIQHSFTVPSDNTLAPAIDRNALNNPVQQAKPDSINNSLASQLQQLIDKKAGVKSNSSPNDNFNVSVGTENFQPVQMDEQKQADESTNYFKRPPMIAVNNNNDILDKGAAGTAQVDLSQKPKGENTGRYLFRSALERIAPDFKITNAEIEEQLNYEKEKFGGYSHKSDNLTDEQVAQSVKNGKGVVPFTVTNRTIQDILNRRSGKTISQQTNEPKSGFNQFLDQANQIKSPFKTQDEINPELLQKVQTDELMTPQGLEKYQNNAEITRQENAAKFKTQEEIEQSIKNPGFAGRVQGGLSTAISMLGVAGQIRTLVDTYNNSSLSADEKQQKIDNLIQQKIADIPKEYGSYREYQKAQDYIKNMSPEEYSARLFGGFIRGTVNTAISSNLEGADVVDKLVEKISSVNPVYNSIPDTLRPTLRNLENGIGYTIASLFGKGDKFAAAKSDSNVDQRLFYTLGKRIEDSLGDDKYLKQDFGYKLSEGLGSATGFLLLGLVAPEASIGKGIGAFSITSGASGALGQAGQMYSDARAKGLDENTSLAAGFAGLPIGATEGFGVGAALNHALEAPERKALAKYLVDFLTEGAEEGAQETVQNVAQDKFMDFVTDKDPSLANKLRNVWNDLPDNIAKNITDAGFSAFLTGGVFGTAVHGITHLAEKSAEGKNPNQEYLPDEIKAEEVKSPRFTTGEPETLKTQAEIKIPTKQDVQSVIGQNVEVNGKTGIIVNEKPKSYIIDYADGTRSEANKKRVEFVNEAINSDVLNTEAPIPERPQTLAAQVESTERADSPRIATLFTKGVEVPSLTSEQNKTLFDLPLPETDETLRINKNKVKEFLGTANPEQIKDYVSQNGYASLIAKAENVGTNTASQPSEVDGITARDEQGNELSWSKVTNLDTLAKQAEINKQEFGENVSQQLETSGQVIEGRKASNELTPNNQHSEIHEIAKNVLSNNDYSTVPIDSIKPKAQTENSESNLPIEQKSKPAFEVRRDTRLEELGYHPTEIADMTGVEKQEIINLNKPEAVQPKEADQQPAKIQQDSQPLAPKAEQISSSDSPVDNRLSPEDDQLVNDILHASGLSNEKDNVAENSKSIEPHELTRDEFGETSPTLKPFGNEPYQLTGKSGEISQQERGTSGFKSAEAMDKWVDAKHREIVEQAIKEGKTVPPEVLEDYPDLAKKGDADNPHFAAALNNNSHETLLTRRIKSLANLKPERLLNNAKVNVEDGIVYASPQAIELIRRALYNVRGKDDLFLGAYLPKSVAHDVLTSLELSKPTVDYGTRYQLNQLVKNLNSAIDNQHRDMIVIASTPLQPKGLSYAVEEEKAHRADFRVRDSVPAEIAPFYEVDGYTQAVENVRRQGYDKATDREIHNEVIAKSFRSDAEKTLGITREQVKNIRRKYRDYLLQQGKNSNIIETEFSPINTQNAKEFIEDARNYKPERSFQNNDTGSEEQLGFTNESLREIRRNGRGFSNGFTDGQPETGGQRSGVLETTRTGNERNSLDQPSFAKPTEAELDPENIKEQTESSVEKALSYIWDGKRDVSLPEAGINLARSGVLMAYSVIRTNLYGNSANQISEALSNPFAALTDIFLAYGTNKTKGQRTTTGLSGRAVAQGIGGERGLLRKGLPDAWRVLRHGMTEDELKKFDQENQVDGKEGVNPAFIRNTGIVPLDALIEASKRLSGAVDKPFRAYAEETERYNAAKTEVLNKRRAEILNRRKGEANRKAEEINFRKEMRKLMINPSEMINEQANQYGDYATFQDKNFLGESIEKFRRSLIDDKKLIAFAGSAGKAEMLKLLTYPLHFTWGIAQPFTSTPLSVWEKNLNYFPPTGALKAAYQFYQIGRGVDRARWAEKSTAHREAFLNKLDKNRRITDKGKYAENLKDIWETEDAQADAYFTQKEARQFARVAGHFGLGTTVSSLTVLGLLYGLVSIVGSDKDDDPERTKKRREAGILPESIGIGGIRFQVLNQHPAGRTILAVTNLLEQYQRKGSTTQKMSAAADQLRKDLMEGNPYTDALWSDKFKGKTWQETLARKAAMPIPRVVEEIGETLDQRPRKIYGEGVLAPFMHKFPFLREMLPESDLTDAEQAQRDTLGKRIVSTLSPIKFAQESKDQSTLPETALGTKKEQKQDIRDQLLDIKRKGGDVNQKIAELKKTGELSVKDSIRLRSTLNDSDNVFGIKSATKPEEAVKIFKNAPDNEKPDLINYLRVKKMNSQSAAAKALYQKAIDEYEKVSSNTTRRNFFGTGLGRTNNALETEETDKVNQISDDLQNTNLDAGIGGAVNRERSPLEKQVADGSALMPNDFKNLERMVSQASTNQEKLAVWNILQDKIGEAAGMPNETIMTRRLRYLQDAYATPRYFKFTANDRQSENVEVVNKRK